MHPLTKEIYNSVRADIKELENTGCNCDLMYGIVCGNHGKTDLIMKKINDLIDQVYWEDRPLKYGQE